MAFIGFIELVVKNFIHLVVLARSAKLVNKWIGFSRSGVRLNPKVSGLDTLYDLEFGENTAQMLIASPFDYNDCRGIRHAHN
jgi:hypothetical protein